LTLASWPIPPVNVTARLGVEAGLELPAGNGFDLSMPFRAIQRR
jgi:hypothetical protein